MTTKLAGVSTRFLPFNKGDDHGKGNPAVDGKPAPFHLYSMRQAIEEKFIFDVLKGYITYSRFFKLAKAIADDPDLDKRKASSALARFVNLHPTNITQKTEIIIEHFRSCVMHKLDGKAKAMLVTGSRLQAVKCKLSFDRYIKDKGYRDVHCLVAFSGEVQDDTAKQRFLQEAQAASALDHPNICNIHEVNETDDGQLYLVMAHGCNWFLGSSNGISLTELHPADTVDPAWCRR